MSDTDRTNNQIIGNVGLFFVCYRLSCLGWNVMPTTRNARGIDVVIYSQDGTRTHTIQVKGLSRRSPVPLGRDLGRLWGDFFVICRDVSSNGPTCFILTPQEARELAHRSEKDKRISYWLQPKHYETPEFQENWSRIGLGASQDIGTLTNSVQDKAATRPLETGDIPGQNNHDRPQQQSDCTEHDRADAINENRPELRCAIRGLLAKYSRVVDATDLTDKTKRTYFGHAEDFVRWIEGDFSPGGRKAGTSGQGRS